MNRLPIYLTLITLNAFVVAPAALARKNTSESTTSPTATASPEVNRDAKKAELEKAEIEKKAEASQTRMESLKNRAEKEIDRRIAAMNTLLTVLDKAKHLSSTEKSSLKTQITTEISALTALKSKIAADTDLTVVKTDVASIVASYRIFALFMPKMRLLAAADNLSTISANLTDLQKKLTERVNAKTGDTTALKALLDDMQKKITAITSKSESIHSSVTTLTPDGYPGNKATLESARATLKAAAEDVKSARSDAKEVIEALQKSS